jgi:hypothetical protein
VKKSVRQPLSLQLRNLAPLAVYLCTGRRCTWVGVDRYSPYARQWSRRASAGAKRRFWDRSRHKLLVGTGAATELDPFPRKSSRQEYGLLLSDLFSACASTSKTIDTNKRRHSSLRRLPRAYGAGLEESGFRVEVSDSHDQVIVRITATDDPGTGLRLFGRQNDDADATFAMRNRPFEVGSPLQAYSMRLSFQRRSKSRLIRSPTVLANDLVFPHRHDDGSAVVAYCRSAEVLTGAGGTKMLKTSRQGPNSLHIAAARTTFQRRGTT